MTLRQRQIDELRAKQGVEEGAAVVRFWDQHIAALRWLGVNGAVLEIMERLTRFTNIGDKPGQIRPGKNGLQDMYRYLRGNGRGIRLGDLVLFSGIDLISAFKLEQTFFPVQDAGFNPTAPKEVAEFWRIQETAPEKVNEQLKNSRRLRELENDPELNYLARELADFD